LALFLDCDGVLADFDKLATEILGMNPHDFEARYKAKEFWRQLRHWRSPEGNGFFRSLPLMVDAMELFEAVRHLNPVILTGCPFGDWAPKQKLEWAEEHFPGTRMITCAAKDKILHMAPEDVLIDDREKHMARWVDAGGTWITHTSAATSLAELRALRPHWFA
jgi:5'(3')-deoxyribonucleotidase